MKSSLFNDEGYMINEEMSNEIWKKTVKFTNELISETKPMKVDAILLEVTINKMIEMVFSGYRLKNARIWTKIKDDNDVSITDH